MTHRTIKTLNKVADTLEATVKVCIAVFGLAGQLWRAIVSPKEFRKEVRKAHRTYTRRSPSYVRHSVYRQAPPTLTIKIVQEKEQ